MFAISKINFSLPRIKSVSKKPLLLSNRTKISTTSSVTASLGPENSPVMISDSSVISSGKHIFLIDDALFKLNSCLFFSSKQNQIIGTNNTNGGTKHSTARIRHVPANVNRFITSTDTCLLFMSFSWQNTPSKLKNCLFLEIILSKLQSLTTITNKNSNQAINAKRKREGDIEKTFEMLP